VLLPLEIPVLLKTCFLKPYTSHLPSKYRQFLEELQECFPGSRKFNKKNQKYNLKSKELGESTSNSKKEGCSPLINEERSHLSSIPTSILKKKGKSKMKEQEIIIPELRNNQERVLTDNKSNNNDQQCEQCIPKLTSHSCTYCKYFVLHEREYGEGYISTEPNLDAFEIAIEKNEIDHSLEYQDSIKCESDDVNETLKSPTFHDKSLMKVRKKEISRDMIKWLKKERMYYVEKGDFKKIAGLYFNYHEHDTYTYTNDELS